MPPLDAIFWMEQALDQARCAARNNEVPVGAILVHHNQCIAHAYNRMRLSGNPSMHAEMQIIAEGTAWSHGSMLRGCRLYVTLEPCAMCAHALRLAQIPTIYFGAYDPRGGAIEHGPRLFDDPHFFKPDVYGGILEQKSQELLKAFFQERRPVKTKTSCALPCS